MEEIEHRGVRLVREPRDGDGSQVLVANPGAEATVEVLRGQEHVEVAGRVWHRYAVVEAGEAGVEVCEQGLGAEARQCERGRKSVFDVLEAIGVAVHLAPPVRSLPVLAADEPPSDARLQLIRWQP